MLPASVAMYLKYGNKWSLFLESIEEVKNFMNPSIQEWIDKLDKEYGLKVLSFNWVQGYRHFMTKDKEVRTPEDLKGLRIRTAPAPIWQESVRALGATPVALNFDEMYTALQQGAIDGAELVYDNVTSGNLYEVLNYISETRHFLLVNFEVISSKWFYSLPEEYQKILVEECDRAGLETSYLIEENTEKTKEIIREKGVTIIEDVDLEAFKKAGEAAYEVLGISEAKEKVYQEIGK